MHGRLCERSNLHNWTFVCLMCPENIVNHAPDDGGPEQQRTIVHVRRSDFGLGRPEAKEGHKNEIENRDCVNQDAQKSFDTPWTPSE